MPRFEWKADFETHVGSVDAQHRRLFEMMAALDAAIEAGESNKALGETLRGLVAYITDHFSYEEHLFRENAYSKEKEHRAQHDQLRRHVALFLKDLRAERPVQPAGLLTFLKTWWNNHILMTDLQYAQEFRDKGVSVENTDLVDFLSKRIREQSKKDTTPP